MSQAEPVEGIPFLIVRCPLYILLLGLCLAGSCTRPTPPLHQEVWGTLADGRAVQRFTLRNDQGMEVSFLDYGALLTAIRVPDRAGKIEDIVLGFDSLAPYLIKHPRFGSLIGRYANRIKGASFTLDGKEYILDANSGPNHIHGGFMGFDQVLWDSEPITGPGQTGVELSYLSPDGEGGYPGNLQVIVRYLLNETNELTLEMEAQTDQATPVNLTQHVYFNLNGARGPVYDHWLQLNADSITVFDEQNFPTGEVQSVAGTPFDFREPQAIGARIDSLAKGGYDQNYALRNWNHQLQQAASAYDPLSGRSLEVFTTQPGLQFFTANGLKERYKGKKGLAYPNHYGFCLETQHFPDSPNQPYFPSTILRPGERYQETVVYRFGIKKSPNKEQESSI